MKIFKIVLISLFAFLFLLMAGIVIFFKTFDLNKHIPQVTRQLATMLGRDVKVEQANMGFSLSQGIGIQISGVVLADDPKFSAAPFLTVDRIEVGLNVNALVFQHSLQVTNVLVVAPRVVIVRSPDGQINAAGIGKLPVETGVKASSADTKAPPAAMLALLVKDIKVSGAEITFIDKTMTPELSLRLERVDVQMKELSFTQPFHGLVKAAVFAKEQNLTIDADFSVDIARQLVRITGLKGLIDLASIDPARLQQELPMIGPAGLKKFQGIVTVAVGELTAGAAGLSDLKAQVLLDNGEVVSTLAPDTLRNIAIQADINAQNIDVKNISLVVAGGSVKATALVSDYLTDPAVSTLVNGEGIDIKKLLESYKLPVKVSGALVFTADLKFRGKTPEAVMASLKGDVKGALSNGQLDNVNLLAMGLGKIPLLSGVLESAMSGLPAETQKASNQGITRLDTCLAQANIADGIVHISAADVATPDLQAHVLGTINLAGPLDLKADIRIVKEVSDRLTEKSGELAGLKDEQGRIYLPVNVSGTLLKVKIIPDMKYLAQKMIAAQGSEKLQEVLGTPEAAQAVNAVFDLFKSK